MAMTSIGKHPIYDDIYQSVRIDGSIMEPFSARGLVPKIGKWPHDKLAAFLAKHCHDNQHGPEKLFVRVYRGRYRLNDNTK